MFHLMMSSRRAIKKIRKKLKSYILKNNIHSLVIGVSGGIDSALCCALAEPICEELKIPLIGISLPQKTNKPDEVRRAKMVGQAFCTEFHEVPIDTIFEQMSSFVFSYILDDELIKTRIWKGNVKARIRMIYLYNVASMRNGLVLSTDNYTEYLLGFWTLHGDVGDLGMIQHLWKSDVYSLSHYIADEYLLAGIKEKYYAILSCIYAIPTDGLGVSETDFDQLGVPTYKEIDAALKLRFFHKNNPVVKRYILSKFKRNNPHNIKL